MFETLIMLRPLSDWRRVATWYSAWAPEWLRPGLRRITPDHISEADLVSQMNEALRLPGLANAWAMPIRGRMDMLTSGVRTAIGLKITGSSIDEIERVASEIAALLQSAPGTRGAFAERLGQGNFLDLQWNREALARAGLTMDDAQASVQYGVGGEHVTDIIEGRERYPVQVRFLADFRTEPDTLGRLFVSTEDGRRQVPLADLVRIRTTSGPAMLRNDDGLPTGYVYLDVPDQDYASYIGTANRLIHERVHLLPGYSISWTGEYEAGARARQQLFQIVPLTLLIIVLLIYASTRSFPKTLLVLLAVPFSAIGAIWTLYWLGYHTSIAVWVGLIALMGVDAETGIFMLLYLDEALDRAKGEHRLDSLAELRHAIIEGSARRVRPKFMTVVAMFFGLVPILWSTGTGSEVMKRIAAPMAGGILTSFALELIVYPAIYYSWKARSGAYRLSYGALMKPGATSGRSTSAVYPSISV
jgi:Cu(I)/Ag(I) efflux system membrane protein CusA/SilA